MIAWLLMSLATTQTFGQLRYIDPTFKTDPSWHDVTETPATDSNVVKSANPELPPSVVERPPARYAVRVLEVGGATYPLNWRGVRAFCEHNPVACETDPLRGIARDVATERALTIAGGVVAIGSLLTVSALTRVCLSERGCSRTVATVDLGFVGLALLGGGFEFYNLFSMQRSLRAWQEAIHGTLR